MWRCVFFRCVIIGNVIGGITSRRGQIIDSEVRDDEFVVIAEVALNDMFGYSSQLRGQTQGKGEFSMEYKVCYIVTFEMNVSVNDLAVQNHAPVLPQQQKELEDEYKKKRPQKK